MILVAHHQKEEICSDSFATNFVPLDWTLLLRTWQRTYSFWNWLMSCWFYTVRLENACKNVKKKNTLHFFSIFLPNTTIFNCGQKFQLIEADFVRVLGSHFWTANVHHAINKNTATAWFSIFSSQLLITHEPKRNTKSVFGFFRISESNLRFS